MAMTPHTALPLFTFTGLGGSAGDTNVASSSRSIFSLTSSSSGSVSSSDTTSVLSKGAFSPVLDGALESLLDRRGRGATSPDSLAIIFESIFGNHSQLRAFSEMLPMQ